ncbi:MAG: hypothetical protein ACKO2G_14600 [Verrucomicrobiales bacterium]
MAAHFHLSLLETDDSSGPVIGRAEIWQSPEDGAGTREPVADLVFEVNGVGSVKSDLAAFFPLALLLAMRAGKNLKVHGSLPSRWESDCQRFQEIAIACLPGCSLVAVDAQWDRKPRGTGLSGEGILFSADLDSISALHQISPSHLIHIGSSTGAEKLETFMRNVADRLSAHLVTVVPRITLHGHHSFHLDDVPALMVAAVANLLSESLGKITWPSPRNWNSPPRGGDHFALTECFLPEGNVLQFSGRGLTAMEKWTQAATIPWAGEFLQVCERQTDDGIPCGTCPSCLRTRIALYALGEETEWPRLVKCGPMNAELVSACVECDRELCEEALAVIKQRDETSEVAAWLDESLRRDRLDNWARRLGEVGREAIDTPAWTKLSRRLLPQVLATAARVDSTWLLTLADQYQCTGGSSDD